ncbi:MAG TPA: class D sortase [Terriglobales bacterium]
MKLKKAERILLALGLLLLGFYALARLQGAILSRAAVVSFQSKAEANSEDAGSSPNPGLGITESKPDFSLWSEKRIHDYQDSLAAHFSPALAVLRIPKLSLEVPVLEGTDDLTLNRGVGRIAGTAEIGDDGNIGIAGHRDGFFRGLKDVKTGDSIELLTAESSTTYVVDNIVVVEPADVSILNPRAQDSITLVTCYPFYFVGSAPKRYIVQASLKSSIPATSVAESQSASGDLSATKSTK